MCFVTHSLSQCVEEHPTHTHTHSAVTIEGLQFFTLNLTLPLLHPQALYVAAGVTSYLFLPSMAVSLWFLGVCVLTLAHVAPSGQGKHHSIDVALCRGADPDTEIRGVNPKNLKRNQWFVSQNLRDSNISHCFASEQSRHDKWKSAPLPQQNGKVILAKKICDLHQQKLDITLEVCRSPKGVFQNPPVAPSF